MTGNEELGSEITRSPIEVALNSINNKLTGRALVVMSGGQDSATCFFWAKKKFKEVHVISFDYGQRHSAELDRVRDLCELSRTPLLIVNLETMFSAITKSALLDKTSDIGEIINGLPASFVPNRNQIFLTLAHTMAQKIGAEHLITGVCETDFSGYPDCRRNFIDCLQYTTNLGSKASITIHTPLMYLDKADTFRLAEKIGVLDDIIHRTLTCYEGDLKLNEWGMGCGECPACKLRQQGYEEYKRRYRGV